MGHTYCHNMLSETVCSSSLVATVKNGRWNQLCENFCGVKRLLKESVKEREESFKTKKNRRL